MYCLVNHGYHVSLLIEGLFFVERMNDYEMMLIHHFASNILLITSNYGQCHRWGAAVLFLHDVPDIFVALVRVFDSLEDNAIITVLFGYLPMIITWFYFRLIYLPWLIYGIIFYCTYPAHLADMNEYLKT